MKHIVQFSGGKDSTAMLLMMIEKGMQIDEIIFCDTGKEFPAMYEHIKEVERYTGRKITTLKAPKSFDYYFCEHVKTKGKNQGHKGYGWASAQMRWCTSRLKIDVTRKYLSQLKEPYTLYLGIAYDEPKRHENRAENMEHPLYDWKITEKQALSYCYERGFTWGGTYEIFSRVSCWCCPLQPLDELRKLRKFYPELWEELRQMDLRQQGCKFKADYTVEDLEERFSKEEMQQALF